MATVQEHWGAPWRSALLELQPSADAGEDNVSFRFKSVAACRGHVRDFCNGKMLCWLDRPGSAKSAPSNSLIHHRPIRMKTGKLLFAAFVLASLVAVGLWLWSAMRIDSCLDRGGRWDKNAQVCEGATE